MSAIECISKACLQIAEEKRVKLNLSIVTNGTLLSPPIVERLLELSVNRAMITLDGPPEIHNARRPFKDGKGTFETIFNNLIYAKGKMGIVIGVNFDKHNYQAIPSLFRFLKENIEHLTAEDFNIAVGQVAPGLSPTPHCNMFSSELTLGGKWMGKLYREAIKCGIRTDDPIGFGLCTLNKESAFVIDPYGNIYKCITGVGREQFKVGSIIKGFIILPSRGAESH